jgi:hypothetical protein
VDGRREHELLDARVRCRLEDVVGFDEVAVVDLLPRSVLERIRREVDDSVLLVEGRTAS